MFADSGWTPAPRVVTCDVESRPGYKTKKAHEYMETPETLAAKVKELARLVNESKNCVLYTGAGLSTASGVADYASKAKNSVGVHKALPKLRSPLDAQPTLAHYTFSVMSRADKPTGGKMISRWIQQNHDGLPQKAGVSQSIMNEIHGAWFSPDNPVVPMSGSLRDDLFSDLLEWEEKADLVLSLGTSMCGMNADRVGTTCAERSMEGKTRGMVLINLQQTQYDALSSLRIYAKIDDVMAALARELGLHRAVRDLKKKGMYRMPLRLNSQPGLPAGVYRVPYCPRTGRRTTDGSTCDLDLREGAKVKLTGGMYEGDTGVMLGKNSAGHFRVQLRHLVKRKSKGKPAATGKTAVCRMMGAWWPETLVDGSVAIMPMVNIP